MSIQSILNNPSLPDLSKQLAVAKWKFNQFPKWYRQTHTGDIAKTLEDIKRSYDTIFSKQTADKQYKNALGEALPF